MGRKRKVPRGRPRSKSAPAVLHSPHKKSVSSGPTSPCFLLWRQWRTVHPFNVPPNFTSGRVQHGRKPGPSPYLSNAEEKELASFITDVAKAGYGKSQQEIKQIAEDVANEKGVLKKTKRRFMERQPELSLRRGDANANVQMDCLNPEVMKKYFELL